jgi:hypothetical protein
VKLSKMLEYVVAGIAGGIRGAFASLSGPPAGSPQPPVEKQPPEQKP